MIKVEREPAVCRARITGFKVRIMCVVFKKKKKEVANLAPQ